MGSALDGVHIVGKRNNSLVIGVVVLQCDLGNRRPLTAGNVYNVLVKQLRALLLVKIRYERAYASLVAEALLGSGLRTLVDKDYRSARIKKRLLAQTAAHSVGVKLDGLEHGLVRPEPYGKTGFIGIAQTLHRLNQLSALEHDRIFLAVTVIVCLEPTGKRVYHGRADPVKSAGNLISGSSEFSARMKYREYNLQSRSALGGMYSRRHSASVVLNGNGSVGAEIHNNIFAIACKHLVDGIIDYFVNQMMKSAR